MIADSGGTKTDWALLKEDGSLARFKTIGLNPYFVDAKTRAAIAGNELLPRLGNEMNFDVYFYGSGLGNDRFQAEYYEFFRVLGAQEVLVDTDLAGLGRAAFGLGTGVAGILGTGANAGYFEDGMLVKSAPSLGYILGDEGSSTWIGKHLMAHYLRNTLPGELAAWYRANYALEPAAILRKVYSGERPNEFIGGWAGVIEAFPQHSFLQALLTNGFKAFFEHYIQPLAPSGPVIMTGSVATRNVTLLQEIAGQCGFPNLDVLPSVIDGLVEYFRQG